MISETAAFIAIMITVASSSGGLALYMAELFRKQRHDFTGRLRHRDRRFLRLEQFLHDKLDFDLSSDLPFLEEDDERRK